MGAPALGRVVLVAAALVLLSACTASSDRQRLPFTPTITGQGTSTPPRPTLSAMCADPAARVTTAHPIGVGSPGAPTVGAFSFHPYPYRAGYPTKMIVHWIRATSGTMHLRGWRCRDGVRLRLAYGDDPTAIFPGRLPLTARQLARLGTFTANFPLGVADGDRGGYALFRSAGAWALTVTDRGQFLGSLRIDVSISLR